MVIDVVAHQGEEVIQLRDGRESHVSHAVVHGYRDLGGDLPHQGLGLLGADGVETAHGDQGHIQAGEGFSLLWGERTADVSEMGQTETAGFQDVNGVGPPEGSALGVMEGVDGGDAEGVLAAAAGPDHMGGVVVIVLVGAQDQVGVQVQGGEAGDVVILVGVKDHSEVLAGQGEAGVAVPSAVPVVP